MMDRLNDLTTQYRRSGVLLDTNLFMLLMAGSVDSQQVSRFRRTSRYTADDFLLLELLLKPFEIVITTPNVLTEVSNPLGNVERNSDLRPFNWLIDRAKILQEFYTPSIDLIGKPEFLRLGLTDAGLIHTARNKYLLLTDDLDLYLLSEQLGSDAIHFTPLRNYFLD